MKRLRNLSTMKFAQIYEQCSVGALTAECTWVEAILLTHPTVMLCKYVYNTRAI